MTFLTKVDDLIYTVTIGDYKISLTAFLSLVVGFIVSLAMIYYMPNSFQPAVVTLLMALVVSYELNCYEYGKCDTFAWIVYTLYLIYSIILVYIMYKHKTAPLEFNQLLSTATKFMSNPFSSKL